MEEEFSQLLQVMKRAGGIMSTTIRTAWNTPTLRISTRNKPVMASNCHISFICHVTRRELRKSLTENDRGNGFANRFLWCHSARTKKVPFPVSINELGIEDDIEKLRKATTSVRFLDPFEVFLSKEAKQYYGDIYLKLSDSHEGLWGEVTDRAVPQIVRIALVYCLLDGDMEIQYKHILAAEHLWDYCDQSARWAFEQNQYSDKALRILTALDQGPLSMTDIHKLFSGRMHKWDLGDLLNEISHLIKVTFERTSGRDKQIVSLIEDIEL